TPLDEAPRLSAELGLRLLVKRDDQTGLALGGNKARKLQYLLNDAADRGCDTLVTAGGAQSNFARMTAAAAARSGMGCHLVLGGSEPAHFSGNLVLDRLFGARLHFPGTDDWSVLESEVRRIADDLGARAYAMPIGGATPVGALAYAAAADELLGQMERPPDWIVVADGSGGTHAGLLAGLPATVRVLGIDVSRPPVPLAASVPRLAAKTAALAGRPAPAGDVIIADHCGPRYASITAECQEAVRMAARTEGLVLDPVYTGKAMAGLIAAARAGIVSGTVVFLHTGGAVALFADEFSEF
ncbi:MAG TPA: pyridoxal-phosphate dependent enzyme, partial [Dehalococcoidia bacterium]|nr:pyridoxal-phosphate dependent enzyme [Dehalococcoidia bacterium]